MEINRIIALVLLLGFFVILTFGGVWVGIPLPGMFLSVWILFAVLCAICGDFHRKGRVSRLLLWMLAPILAAVIVSGIISGIQESKAEQAAASVVVAIEHYQATNNGVPPASLGDLVPAYFQSVPTTHFGPGSEQFFYQSRSNGFRLSYLIPLIMVRSYDSDTHKWRIKD